MKTKTGSPQIGNSLSVAGIFLLLVSISILALWIITFSSNPSASQDKKVEIFHSYFPTFLRNNSSISAMVLASSAGAIILAILGRMNAKQSLKDWNIVVISIASLVLLLQLFSLL